MCDCNSHIDKQWTDCGKYWVVVEVCTRCGKTIRQYTVQKDSEDQFLMARLNKSIQRDREISRRKHGHREDGRSVFLNQEIQKKKAEKLRRERKKKEELLDNED